MQVDMGCSVAILGSKLGILHAAVAQVRGAAPIILLGRNEKRLEMAKNMGADFTINVTKVKDPVEEVKKLTGGRGADYVIEAVGTPQTYEQAFAMVRPGGVLAAFGITGAEDTLRIAPVDIVIGERTITGSCAGFGTDWNDSIALLQYGRIKPTPLFSMVVPLEELEQVLHELQTNQDITKVFVSPSSTKRELF
jgi:threonine dehydrogenase-like Zn-dependent dehydrogenase